MRKKLWICVLLLFISTLTKSVATETELETSEIAETEAANDLLEEEDLAREETTTETAAAEPDLTIVTAAALEPDSPIETDSAIATKKSNSTGGGGSVFSNFLTSAANVAGAQVGLQLASEALGRPPIVNPGFPLGGYPQPQAPYSPYNNYNPQFSPYVYNPYQNAGGYNNFQGSNLGSFNRYPSSYYPASTGGYGGSYQGFGGPSYNSGFGNSNTGYSNSQLGSGGFDTFQRTDANGPEQAKAANPHRGSSDSNNLVGTALAAGAGLALLGAFNSPSNYYPNSGGGYQSNYSPYYGGSSGYNSPYQPSYGYGNGYRPHRPHRPHQYYKTVDQSFDNVNIANQEDLLYTDPKNYLRDGELPPEDPQNDTQVPANLNTNTNNNNITSILVPIIISSASTYYPYQTYPYITDYTQVGKIENVIAAPEIDNETPSTRKQSDRGSQVAGSLLGATAGYVLASSLLGGGNNGGYYNQQPYYSGYSPSYYGGSGYNSPYQSGYGYGFRPQHHNSHHYYRTVEQPYFSYNDDSGNVFRNLPAVENLEVLSTVTKANEIVGEAANQIEVARLDINNLPANQEVNAQIVVSETSN